MNPEDSHNLIRDIDDYESALIQVSPEVMMMLYKIAEADALLAALAQSEAPSHVVDKIYRDRDTYIIVLVGNARADGLEAGFRADMDPTDTTGADNWPVAYVELPTGQVIWPLQPHPEKWDGHTNADRADRISVLTKAYYGHDHPIGACCGVHSLHTTPHRNCILR